MVDSLSEQLKVFDVPTLAISATAFWDKTNGAKQMTVSIPVIAKDLIFIFLGFAGKFFRIRGKYEFMPEVRVLSQTTSHLNSGS
jgi:hypothetical protein